MPIYNQHQDTSGVPPLSPCVPLLSYLFLMALLTLLTVVAGILSQFLSKPELFNQIYTHTDVRLALGWACVFIAGGTGLYGWRVEFEKSKPVVWAGLILYVSFTPAPVSSASPSLKRR